MNMNSLGSNSLDSTHNYQSLYEEIAQVDNNYLNRSNYFNNTKCCCCKIHSSNFAITPSQANKNSENMPIYDSIREGEMKNAADYELYLNTKRRNSFNNITNANIVNSNKCNKHINKNTNYYKISVDDYGSNENEMNDSLQVFSMSTNLLKKPNSNFLSVPQLTDDDLRKTPEFDDIARKINQINLLDNSVGNLIYKAIEVHADILALDATVNRLLAETRKILDELEDVQCLDDIIAMLNSTGPVIHREWNFPIFNPNEIPVEEGVSIS